MHGLLQSSWQYSCRRRRDQSGDRDRTRRRGNCDPDPESRASAGTGRPDRRGGRVGDGRVGGGRVSGEVRADEVRKGGILPTEFLVGGWRASSAKYGGQSIGARRTTAHESFCAAPTETSGHDIFFSVRWWRRVTVAPPPRLGPAL
jgi:hypothetical protein